MEEILPKAEGFNLKTVGFCLIKISEFERKAYKFPHLVLRQTHRITFFAQDIIFVAVMICPRSPFTYNQNRKISCSLQNICISSHRMLCCDPDYSVKYFHWSPNTGSATARKSSFDSDLCFVIAQMFYHLKITAHERYLRVNSRCYMDIWEKEIQSMHFQYIKWIKTVWNMHSQGSFQHQN